MSANTVDQSRHLLSHPTLAKIQVGKVESPHVTDFRKRRFNYALFNFDFLVLSSQLLEMFGWGFEVLFFVLVFIAFWA